LASDVTFADALHGWALARIMERGDLPNCQHAGTTCHDVILATVDGGRTWSTVRSVYTTGVTGYTFHGLQFVDAKHGWTAQYIDTCSQPCAGELLATDDGGATWSVRSRADGVFTAFHFVDTLRGWAIESGWWSYFGSIARETRLLATADGGRTWTRRLDGVPVYDVTATDPTHAWAIAHQYDCGPGCAVQPVQLYRTTDGEHWSLIANDLAALSCVGPHIFGPVFIDAQRGVVTSGGPSLDDRGGVLVTQDGGVTWSCAASQPAPSNAQQQALRYGDSLLVITRGIDGSDHVLATSDLGARWSERDLPPF
jgi:photosystem II stability/assembly factor-like uncharacterized protein